MLLKFIEHDPFDDIFPGTRITEDDQEMLHDEDRDEFTIDQRIQATRFAWEMHKRNRERKLPYSDSMELASGNRESAKTLVTMSVAAARFMAGYWVASTPGTGAGIGWAIDPATFFVVSELAPKNGDIVGDEFHTLSDTQSDGSNRVRYFNNAISMARKNGHRIRLMSAQEWRVSHTVRADLDWLIYPEPYIPQLRMTSHGRMMRGAYPAWAYRKVYAIGPRPFEGRRLIDEIRQGARKKKKKRRLPPPIYLPAERMLTTGKLYGSFATTPVDQGISLRAAQIAEAMKEKREQVASATRRAGEREEEDLDNLSPQQEYTLAEEIAHSVSLALYEAHIHSDYNPERDNPDTRATTVSAETVIHTAHGHGCDYSTDEIIWALKRKVEFKRNPERFRISDIMGLISPDYKGGA